ncbi:hypothetical protein ARMGADRAFT_1031414 [Armillaria gallica]|uniref:Secreted protein n=1 Tax=Armillaria gallica TaxID=47427 RepID=A0A2H3D9M6_ARMGA|nr:hypothetical protein ARMGADRAFT_1031414 [Armillaria gallica]
MFSRILVLFPLVAFAVASRLVARSGISALQQDFAAMEKTVGDIQNACDQFKSAPTQANAMDLDNEIKKAIPDVPDKVVSDADGQTICTTLKDFFPKVLSTLDCLISAKGSFATAGVPDPAVCSLTNNLNGDNSKFIDRLDAACPDSAKACAQDLTDQIVAKAAEVKKAYDC